MGWFANKKAEILDKAMVRFAKARSRLFQNFPRLYDTIDLCHVKMESKVPTLGVAPRKNGEYDFMWNPEFIAELSDMQVEAVIKHELLHIVFGHTTVRFPKFDFDIFDPEANQKAKADDIVKARLWNLATDCAINQFIRDELTDLAGKKLDCIFPENFMMPEWLNAEAYYRLLAEQLKNEMKMLKELQKKLLDAHQEWNQEGQEGKQGQGQQDSKQGQSGKGQGEQKEGAVAGHGGATDADPSGGQSTEFDAKDLVASGKETSDKEANDQKLKDIAEDLGVDKFNEQADRAAAEMQKSGGKDAGKYGGVGKNVVVMNRGAGEKATPGWMRKTKHEAVHGFDIVIEQTRKRPNRRYGNLFPGKKRQDTGNKLLIAVDISGSISMPLFAKFCQHINKFLRFSSFDIVFFNDYLVDENGKILFSAYEKGADPRKAIRKFRLNQKQKMGGGTNFETVMLLWNKVGNNYDGLFIFTDGEATYSTPPKHPREVNWIVYPDGYNVELRHLKHGNIFNMTNEKYTREMPKVR